MASKKVGDRVNRTRRRVIDESARLFVENDYENVTVEQIISQAGIARSSFYRFFDNKEDVLAQIIRPMFARGLWLLNQIDTEDPRSKMGSVIAIYPVLWEEFSQALILSVKIGPRYIHLFRAEHQAFVDRITDLIRSVNDSKILRNHSSLQTTMLVSRVAVTIMQVYNSDPAQRTKFIDTMTGMLLTPE